MKMQSLPCYCSTLRQAARAATALYEQVLAEGGVHATQFGALQLIDSTPNLTTTELAEAIGIDQTTATRTLALIKRDGLARDAVGQDRRQRHWSMTSKGRERLRKSKSLWETAQAEFERRIGRTEALALRQAAYFAATRLASG